MVITKHVFLSLNMKNKPLKEFRITADLKFFAENIDDAMKQIGLHFIRYDKDENTPEFLGEILCEPVKENITTTTE